MESETALPERDPVKYATDEVVQVDESEADTIPQFDRAHP